MVRTPAAAELLRQHVLARMLACFCMILCHGCPNAAAGIFLRFVKAVCPKIAITRPDKFLSYWYRNIDPDNFDPSDVTHNQPGQGRPPLLSDELIDKWAGYCTHLYGKKGQQPSRHYHSLKEVGASRPRAAPAAPVQPRQPQPSQQAVNPCRCGRNTVALGHTRGRTQSCRGLATATSSAA